MYKTQKWKNGFRRQSLRLSSRVMDSGVLDFTFDDEIKLFESLTPSGYVDAIKCRKELKKQEDSTYLLPSQRKKPNKSTKTKKQGKKGRGLPRQVSFIVYGDIPNKYYDIKIWSTGKCQVPGVIREDNDDVMLALKRLFKFLKKSLGRKVKLISPFVDVNKVYQSLITRRRGPIKINKVKLGEYLQPYKECRHDMSQKSESHEDYGKYLIVDVKASEDSIIPRINTTDPNKKRRKKEGNGITIEITSNGILAFRGGTSDKRPLKYCLKFLKMFFDKYGPDVIYSDEEESSDSSSDYSIITVRKYIYKSSYVREEDEWCGDDLDYTKYLHEHMTLDDIPPDDIPPDDSQFDEDIKKYMSEAGVSPLEIDLFTRYATLDEKNEVLEDLKNEALVDLKKETKVDLKKEGKVSEPITKAVEMLDEPDCFVAGDVYGSSDEE